MIGATLVASYSAPSSPKDAGHTVKSATLGTAGMKFRLAAQSVDCPTQYLWDVCVCCRQSTKSGMASSAILGRARSELTSLPPARPKAPSPDPSSVRDTTLIYSWADVRVTIVVFLERR